MSFVPRGREFKYWVPIPACGSASRRSIPLSRRIFLGSGASSFHLLVVSRIIELEDFQALVHQQLFLYLIYSNPLPGHICGHDHFIRGRFVANCDSNFQSIISSIRSTMTEGETPRHDAWKLLSKGPPVPYRQHVPFQTKIQRHYPFADEVPYAGKTTNELSAQKNVFKRLWEYPPQYGKTRMPSLKTHFQGTTLEPIAIEKQPLKRLSLSRNREGSHQPAVERPSKRLSSPLEQHEASSEQVQILVQSQSPPYCGGQYKHSGPRFIQPVAGISSKPEELIAPPDRIGPYNKRVLPKQIRPDFIRFDVEDVAFSGPRKYYSTTKDLSLNVFNYPLPSTRSKNYIGCIETKSRNTELNKDNLQV